MAKGDPIQKRAKASKQPEKRRRLRRLFLLVLLMFLVLMGVLVSLPYLLSTKTGQYWLQQTLQSRLAGDLRFQDLSLSWRRGLQVQSLQWHDPNAGIHIDVASLTANPHLLSLLSGNLSLGTTTVRQPILRIAVPSVPESSPSGKPESPKGPSPEEAPHKLRIQDLRLVIEDGSLTLDLRGTTTVIEKLNLDVQLLAQGSLTAVLRATILDDNQDANLVVRVECPELPEDDFSTERLAGDLSASIENLSLSTLQPILAGLGQSADLTGVVGAELSAQVQAGRLGTTKLNLRGEGIDVTWPALGRDRLRSKQLAVTADVESQGDIIAVQAVVKTDFLESQVDGRCSMKGLDLAAFLDSSWSADLSLDLAQLATQCRHSLRLREGMDLTGGQIQGALKIGEGRFQGDLALEGLQGNYEGRRLQLSDDVNLNLVLTRRDQNVQADRFELSAPFASCALQGDLNRISYQQHWDLAAMQRELGSFLDLGPWTYAGVVTTQGTLTQENGPWSLGGTGAITDLQITDPNGRQAGEAKFKFSHEIIFDPNAATPFRGDVQVQSRLANVTLSPGPAPTDDPRASAWRLSCRDLDLARCQSFAVVLGALNEEVTLAGRADLDCILGLGERELYIMAENVTLENLAVKGQGEEPFTQERMRLGFSARADRIQKTFQVEQLSLEADPLTLRDTTIRKALTGDRVTFSAESHCVYDWQVVSALLAAFVPEGLDLSGQREDVITVTTSYPVGREDQALTGLSARARLGFDRALYQGLEVGPTDVNLLVDQGSFELQPFVSTVNQGRFQFGCRADLKEQPLLFELSAPMSIAQDIHITGPLAHHLLKYINPLFADLSRISGRLDFEGQRLVLPVDPNRKDKLEVIGTIAMRDIQLEGSKLLSAILGVVKLKPVRGQHLTVRPTAFTVQNGTVRYENMQIDVGDNPLNFSGTIGLDDTLDMTITLPYTWSGRTVRVNQTSEDRIQLPLGGTLSDPRLNTERFLQDQLRQQLRKQIDKGLEELFERL